MRKIGETLYLSTQSLTYPLKTGAVQADAELVPGGLTELSELLVKGELDAGPISVIEYLRHRDRFERIPNLSVSSWGRAGCGLLFSAQPIGHPAGHEIAIPTRTAGAVYLLRSLMTEMYGVEPRFVEHSAPLDVLLAEHGAALLFEDEALIASQSVPSEVEVWDLGDAWWQLTNTPLIYMLWVTQTKLGEEDRRAIADTLTQAKAAALSVRPQLVAEAAARTGLAEGVIEGFLGRFNYDFTPAHEQGLKLLDQILMRPEMA